MIRVLHIVGGMNRGGLETFIMNVYRSIDRNLVQFDFLVHTSKKCDYDSEIEYLGGKIHKVTRKNKNFIKNFIEINKIVKINQYKIIHRHTNNSLIFLDLLAAKLGGSKLLIAHSHSVNASNKIFHKIFRPFLNLIVTKKYACSKDAGKWLFGSKSNFDVINNGIDCSKYIYNKDNYDKVRNELGIQNKFAICHVGRFSKAKNHTFLLDVFNEIHKKNKDSVLILIGDGELLADILRKVNELNLQDYIKILGKRSDVNIILQGMDLFLFPSLYEGLPVSVIEAQATGLNCVISDTITENVIITNLVVRYPLSLSAQQWCNNILESKDKITRKSDVNAIVSAGYDINVISNQLQELYLKGADLNE